MKKKLIILVSLLGIGLTQLQAQEYKLAKSSGTLDIREVNDVNIEGYNGAEIVFSSRSHDRDRDERSKGLRAISSLGVEDNTGIGLSVIDKGGVIEVRQLKKMEGPEVKIMVPKGIKILYSHNSPYGNDVKFKNMENEIEVTTVHNGVYLDNVTGPVSIKTVHGEVEATFATLTNPVSISSAHGHVDITIPASAKVTVKLGTVHGEIFVDPDLKLEIDRSGTMIKYSDNVTGKINGGGVDMQLSSTHGNVYLRKK